MKPFNDDDIEVLGSSLEESPRMFEEQDLVPPSRKGKPHLLWKLVIIVVVTLGVSAVVYLIFKSTPPVETDVNNADADVEYYTEIATLSTSNADMTNLLPREFTDSINDVAFKVVCLDGFKASVTFEKPESDSEDVVFATGAADYRADNGKIVGDFIHDGTVMTKGDRKPGFCYTAPDGSILIGMGHGEEHKQNALIYGGTFFRQFALVIDGEIQPNTLKGKSKRRAIAFLDGKPTIVLSQHRESIYDFSQALADYGFSYALYLPGGEGYLKMHTDKEDVYTDNHPAAEYSNYLVFTK